MSENRREITPSLIARVLLSTASLLEVTGWLGGIARDVYGKPTDEMDLPRALNQVICDSYHSRNGLWKATRESLLDEINKGRSKNGFVSLAGWNDRQKDAPEVIALCRRAAEKLRVQKPDITIEIV